MGPQEKRFLEITQFNCNANNEYISSLLIFQASNFRLAENYPEISEKIVIRS